MTTEQAKTSLKAYLDTVRAVADCIKSVGSIPSGHLYAHLGVCMDLAAYQRVIGHLKAAGLVEERHHELFWIGPD